ncbi:MAG: hypothetical protein PHH82_04130 [Candidatus ainarchaeum sp.]|nr:hypothetical protein [Candidatus ainarchaeum sp.]
MVSYNGKWSLGLGIASIIFFVLGYLGPSIGFHPSNFLELLSGRWPFFVVFILSFVSVGTSLLAIIKDKDRFVFLYIVGIINLLIFLLVLINFINYINW